MFEELLEKCPEVKHILVELAGIAENDIEVQSIIAEKEYPFMTEIYYKVKNIEGNELYMKKDVMGMVYDSVLEELLKCPNVDEETKKSLKKELEELEREWNQYIRDP